MRLRLIGLGAPLALLAALAGIAVARRLPAQPPTPAPEPASTDFLIAHEWGTFLAMSGSDGVSLDGMYHEEHALPNFVHARSQDILKLTNAFIKNETPVIYFYTNKRQGIRAQVWFRDGLWTQWYPQAFAAGPMVAKAGESMNGKNSYLTWTADIIPAAAGTPDPAPPSTSSDSLWNHAREVDAAYVQTLNARGNVWVKETERFLFYRGLGRQPLPLKVESAKGGTLSVDKASKHGVRHAFTLRVEGGKGAYAYHPELKPGEAVSGAIPSLSTALPLDEFVAKLGDDLAAKLVESGLYAKEARAMVNTWSDSYFRTEGIRTLFILPQAWTDNFIPLTLNPTPDKTVRVMVGRVELLTPERERLAETAVRSLLSNDPATRLSGFQTLRDQGRYVEPIVRRVLATTSDDTIRNLCRKLLVTDFVTDLHPTRVGNDSLSAEVQVASLMNQIYAKPKP
jgi:hypothetical protein